MYKTANIVRFGILADGRLSQGALVTEDPDLVVTNLAGVRLWARSGHSLIV
jgi:hypothetical protein